MYTNTLNNNKHPAHSHSWYQRMWRPLAAFVYLSICIFDFIVMPIIVSNSIQQMESTAELFAHIYKLEHSEAQVAAITSIQELRNHEWSPITLIGGGMFHLSFGAIIGVSAVSRGLEKKV